MGKIKSYKELFEEARKSPEYWTEHAVLDYTTALWAQMQEKQVTQAELARSADIAPSMLSRVLNGTHNVTMRTMVRLAHALGMRVRISLEPHQASRTTERPMHTVTTLMSDHATDKVVSIHVKRLVPLPANEQHRADVPAGRRAVA